MQLTGALVRCCSMVRWCIAVDLCGGALQLSGAVDWCGGALRLNGAMVHCS